MHARTHMYIQHSRSIRVVDCDDVSSHVSTSPIDSIVQLHTNGRPHTFILLNGILILVGLFVSLRCHNCFVELMVLINTRSSTNTQAHYKFTERLFALTCSFRAWHVHVHNAVSSTYRCACVVAVSTAGSACMLLNLIGTSSYIQAMNANLYSGVMQQFSH